MNISPINPTAPYQASLAPVDQKNVEELNNPSTSPFRAWTRAAGKMLAATSVASALPSGQSSEAFWAEWPAKKWQAASQLLKS
ncbi:MAG: hypothetical protein K2W97_06075 [Chthoniobacterales bacterium]|nr:hypothetical protein [Chthoniobacterales bacterium]